MNSWISNPDLHFLMLFEQLLQVKIYSAAKTICLLGYCDVYIIKSEFGHDPHDPAVGDLTDILGAVK